MGAIAISMSSIILDNYDIVLYIWLTININIYNTYTSEVFKKTKS